VGQELSADLPGGSGAIRRAAAGTIGASTAASSGTYGIGSPQHGPSSAVCNALDLITSSAADAGGVETAPSGQHHTAPARAGDSNDGGRIAWLGAGPSSASSSADAGRLTPPNTGPSGVSRLYNALLRRKFLKEPCM
jgi:hypothetical protein